MNRYNFNWLYSSYQEIRRKWELLLQIKFRGIFKSACQFVNILSGHVLRDYHVFFPENSTPLYYNIKMCKWNFPYKWTSFLHFTGVIFSTLWTLPFCFGFCNHMLSHRYYCITSEDNEIIVLICLAICPCVYGHDFVRKFSKRMVFEFS